MALALGPAVAGLLTALRGAGLRADVDPEQLTADPACVWVQPRSVDDLTLAGGGTLTCWLYVIVATGDTLHALTLLDDTLAAVLELVRLADDDTQLDLASAVVLPSSPNPLPAFRVAVALDL